MLTFRESLPAFKEKKRLLCAIARNQVLTLVFFFLSFFLSLYLLIYLFIFFYAFKCHL